MNTKTITNQKKAKEKRITKNNKTYPDLSKTTQIDLSKTSKTEKENKHKKNPKRNNPIIQFKLQTENKSKNLKQFSTQRKLIQFKIN